MAPQEGFEPPTKWLTATCSTAELLWNLMFLFFFIIKKSVKENLFYAICLWLFSVAYFGFSLKIGLLLLIITSFVIQHSSTSVISGR